MRSYGSSGGSGSNLIIAVPPQFYQEGYVVDKSLLKITSADDPELQSQRKNYDQYMNIINSDLERSILKNFDFFN